MRSTHLVPSWAPYEPLLLRAATAPTATAVEAWQRALATHPLEAVGDAEAQRLLAAVYHRLVEAGAPATTAELPRLAGIFRRTWALNQQVAAALPRAAEVIAAAGIEAVVDPFTATVLGGDLGRLEVGIPTLLVAPDDGSPAATALGEAGYRATPAPEVALSHRRRRRIVGSDGQSLDLASSAGRWMVDESDPTGWWGALTRTPAPVDVGHRSLTALAGAEALTALITEGTAAGSPIRLRWAVAAAEILATGVDAARLGEVARHLKVGPLVTDGLSFLHHEVGIDVDRSLLDALAPLEATRPALERARGRGRGPFPALRADLALATRSLGAVPALRAVPPVLVDRWELDSVRDLPPAAARRARGRLARPTVIPPTVGAAEAWSPPDIVSRCWPDPVTTLLLHAALGPPEAAPAAWEQARPHLDLDPTHRTEQRRLYPLVWKNLRRVHPDHPDLAVLGLAHREALLRNARAVHFTAGWLEALAEAGIRACLLKGLPLALGHYRDLGERPMADVDVLVPLDQLDAAFTVFAERGWVGEARADDLARLVGRSHATGLFHPEAGGVDLHWSLNKFLIRPGEVERAADSFWDRVEAIEVGGSPAFALDRTDALAHTIVHGAWRGSGATYRWIPDALVLARALDDTGGPDLDRLVWIGERFGVGLMLHEALRYLVHEFDAPVPDPLITALGRVPLSARRLRRYRAATNSGQAPQVLHGLPTWRAFWAQDSWGRTDLEAARMFGGFVVTVTGLSQVVTDPGGTARRLRGRLASSPDPGVHR